MAGTKAVSSKGAEIQDLKAKLESIEASQKLAICEALSALARERDDFRSGLEKAELGKRLMEKAFRDKCESQIKDPDEAIERLWNMKTKLSIKMIGEMLEQHCKIEFNSIRSPGFPRAYFEKANDVRMGSNGDFIFLDYEESGTEFVSSIFEMKNESNTTAAKKNEYFLKELDKDRTEKACGCVIFVSF